MWASRGSGGGGESAAAAPPYRWGSLRVQWDCGRRGLASVLLGNLLAASGAMAETIPPSIVLIMIGSVTGVSIAAVPWITTGFLR